VRRESERKRNDREHGEDADENEQNAKSLHALEGNGVSETCPQGLSCTKFFERDGQSQKNAGGEAGVGRGSVMA
jgi:hypothetical protein